MNLVDLIAQAIATMEGFFKAGSLAMRNNNPGNLRSWGSNPIVNGYAQFRTVEEGWAALKAQVQKNINRGLNLTEIFAGKPGVYGGYAPSADRNDPVNYAKFVAGRVGVDVSTPLKSAQQQSSSTAQASPMPGFPPARGSRSQTSSSKPKGTIKPPSPPPSSGRSR